MAKDLIYILENDILPNMRNSGAVSSVNALGDYYVLTVDNTYDIAVNDILQVKDVSDNDIEVKVTSLVENTSITVKSTVAPVSGEWNALKPYFRYEKWLAETNRIQNMTDKIIKQHKRFPLMFLLLDINEEWDRDEQIDVSYKNAKFFLIEKTDNQAGEYAEERRNETFIPVLYPLHDSFIEQLKANENIYVQNDRLPRTKYDRYFLGTEDNNQNKLNQYVEAIELTFDSIDLVNINTNC